MIKKGAPYSDELAARHKEVIIDILDLRGFADEIRKATKEGLRLGAIGDGGLSPLQARLHFLPEECFDEEVPN